MNGFCEGEYIVYRNNEKYELGRITSLREDGAFVCYHEGETAAKTPYDHMHKLINKHVIKDTSLGGGRFSKPDCEQGRKNGKWTEWEEIEVIADAYDICGVKTWASKMKCNQCGFTTIAIEGRFSQYNFCPHCGARMEDEQE